MREPSPYFISRDSFHHDGVSNAEFVVLEDDSGSDLRQHWWALRKHIGLVLAIPISLAMLTLLYDLMARHLYTAQATVLIQSNAPQIFDEQSMGAVPGTQTQTASDLFQKTEYELLQSRSLAEKVIEAEDLKDSSAFTGERRGAKLADSLFHQVLESIIRLLPRALAGQTLGASAALRQSRLTTRQRLVQIYLSDLRVTPIEGTQLVKVAITTPDPALSATLANAHVHEFIHQRIELNAQASEEAEHFLEQKLVQLKQQLEESELAVNNYRRDKDIIPGLISMNGKADVVLDRLNSLSQQLQDAHLKTIGLGAQVALIDEGRVNSLPAVIESGLIQKLKGDLDGLQAQYTSMSSELKPDYPPMQELQAKISRTEDLVHQEITSVAAGVRAQYSAALRKEKDLQEELDKQKKFALGLNDAAVRYVILEREADTNRQLYNAVLKRMKDVSMVAGIHASNTSLVDAALPPLSPSSPRKVRDVLFMTALGLMASIGTAFAIERLDNTLKNAADAQKFLSVPALGIIPESRSLAARQSANKLIYYGQNPKLDLTDKELTAYGGYSFMGEAYRSLRAALLLSRAGAPPKRIVITSADVAEGKTVTAVNTAVVLAHTGSRVLLIDADLRRPRCHKMLSIRNGRGLTEVLAGTKTLDGVIHDTDLAGMFLLSSGKIPPNPAELLSSDSMKDLLSNLADHYDFIVIDTPPVLPVSDAMVLGSIADGVVMVVDSSATPKQRVKDAIGRLEQGRAKVFGVVLNKVKFNQFGYGYYDSHHYYARRYESDDGESEAADTDPA